MKRIMLSTAMLAALTTVGVAQDAPGLFRSERDPMELRASEFIGLRVYSTETAVDAAEYQGIQQDWQDIGEINDIILGRDGSATAVLVDIGGFLGMGERQVAVDMSAIKFVADSATADAQNDFFLVMSAPRAEFEAAPEYRWDDAAVAPVDGTAPVADTAADATAAPATSPVAQAPADATTATEGATDGAARTPVAREGYMAADAEYLTAEKLTGARVYDANDEWIGDVSELVLSAEGQVTDAVIDVGGFLGIGAKPVALALQDIDILRNEGGDEVRVYLSRTKTELEALPTFGG